MQETGPRLGARAYLGPGRAQSVRDLVGVASLHPAATFAATADADPKTRRHRLHLTDVYLPLLGIAFVLDVTATERAARRQAGFEVQVGRAGGSHAVTVTAVRFAGLSSRPVRLVFFGAAFGERRRLALAGPLGCFQRSLQGLIRSSFSRISSRRCATVSWKRATISSSSATRSPRPTPL